MERTLLVLALLCVAFFACSASWTRYGRLNYHGYNKLSRFNNKYYRRPSSYGPTRTPGLTWDGRPCPYENGCIQLPSTSDVMTIGTFEDQVAGRTTYLMYRIKHANFDNLLRKECTYYIQGNSVNLDLKGRINETLCWDWKNLLMGNYTSQTHAIVAGRDLPYLGTSELMNPAYYFISDHPDVYQILFACLQTSTIRNGFCEGGYYVDIFFTQDPPNNPPFKLIEEELCRKLGLQMDDPLNDFIYIGPACPDT